jgi:sugar phosphate isomerase/epimerase
MPVPGDLPPRLSCTDSSFPRLSHDGALAVIGDLGLAAVDVCVFPEGSHTTPASVRADPGGIADAMLARLVRAGLAVADVFLILGDDEIAINHPDPEVRRESLSLFEATVELARRLGAPGVSVLPGMSFDGVEPDAGLRLAAEGLQRRAGIAGEAGLALSIEPHYLSIVETPERTLELLGLAPDVALALDYSHFVYQGIAQRDVDALIPHARHVHLRQAAEGAMQLPALEGAIDFPRVLQQLKAAGYDGYLTIEYQWEEWLDCNRVDCVSETAELRDLLLA